MNPGDKVICVNDSFPQWAHNMYTALPKKDSTYTIRHFRMGRTDISDPGLDSMTDALTVAELKNPNDPHYLDGTCELAFNANRFRKIKTIKEKRKLKMTKAIGKTVTV